MTQMRNRQSRSASDGDNGSSGQRRIAPRPDRILVGLSPLRALVVELLLARFLARLFVNGCELRDDRVSIVHPKRRAASHAEQRRKRGSEVVMPVWPQAAANLEKHSSAPYTSAAGAATDGSQLNDVGVRVLRSAAAAHYAPSPSRRIRRCTHRGRRYRSEA